MDYFQVVVGEFLHRRDLLAPAVSNLLVNDFAGRSGGRKPIRQYLLSVLSYVKRLILIFEIFIQLEGLDDT